MAKVEECETNQKAKQYRREKVKVPQYLELLSFLVVHVNSSIDDPIDETKCPECYKDSRLSLAGIFLWEIANSHKCPDLIHEKVEALGDRCADRIEHAIYYTLVHLLLVGAVVGA